MKAPAQILESALYADDLDAAERFYADVLGLELIGKADNRHVFFRCGPGVLLVFNAAKTVIPYREGQLPVPPHGARGQGHLCFKAEASEMNGWREHLIAAGVPIESDMKWPGGGRSIYFRDPAGNSLEFAEARIWDIE